MKIGVYGGEAFPVYEIHSDGYTEIEVDDETIKRWKAAFDTFKEVQEEIVAEMEKQGHADKVWYGGVWSGWNIPDNKVGE